MTPTSKPSGVREEPEIKSAYQILKEPKKVGMSYEEYAAKKQSQEEKVKAMEVTAMKSQIKDD